MLASSISRKQTRKEERQKIKLTEIQKDSTGNGRADGLLSLLLTSLSQSISIHIQSMIITKSRERSIHTLICSLESVS